MQGAGWRSNFQRQHLARIMLGWTIVTHRGNATDNNRPEHLRRLPVL